VVRSWPHLVASGIVCTAADSASPPISPTMTLRQERGWRPWRWTATGVAPRPRRRC